MNKKTKQILLLFSYIFLTSILVHLTKPVYILSTIALIGGYEFFADDFK